MLRDRLDAKFHNDSYYSNLHRKWNSYKKEGQTGIDLAALKMAFFNNPESTINNSKKRTQWALREADNDSLWVPAWGKMRTVQWVSIIAGQQEGEGHRTPEVVRFAFNLPGPPYILICTEKAKEGIDLHRYCRKILHYDMEWNPASMEQRVGRVDRIGSLARKKHLPVEIFIMLVTPETYEEKIFSVVMERMKIFRALLGAGEWLEKSQLRVNFASQNGEDPLAPYRLDFSV